ncbi:uncharacterized protein VTP21DRAFT_7424 [Calcarisporiella thermophila]|uniref:uncharacterized protein n=1 Tax=Calcarisporiella thermophila TaxID=911321 RepID=UPI0037426008
MHLLHLVSFLLAIGLVSVASRLPDLAALPPKTVALVTLSGGRSHATPLLEVGKELRLRNHTVLFGTYTDQLRWAPDSAFDRLIDLGPGLDKARERNIYASLQNWTTMYEQFRAMLRSKTDFNFSFDRVYLRLLDEFSRQRPDVLVCDYLVDPCKDLSAKLKVPFIFMFPNMPFRIPRESFQPNVMVESTTTESLSFFQRLGIWFEPYLLIPEIIRYHLSYNRMRAKAGLGRHVEEPRLPNQLFLINSFWGLEPARTIPPTVELVGPLLADTYPPLTQDLADFLELHPRTVYVSFGTHAHLSLKQSEALLNGLLRAVDYGRIDGIVWSIGQTSIANFPREAAGRNITDLLGNRNPNLYFIPFAPQRALLGHPHTRLFVTHGGGESGNEAIYAGKPVIVLPFFADQLFNAARMSAAGIGRKLDRLHFTAHDVFSLVTGILTDEDGEIQRNVERMKLLARLRARSSKQHAADLVEEMMYHHEAWTDHGRLEPGPLKGFSTHRVLASNWMPYIKANEIDLKLFILGTVSLLGWLLFKWVRTPTRKEMEKRRRPKFHFRDIRKEKQ